MGNSSETSDGKSPSQIIAGALFCLGSLLALGLGGLAVWAGSQDNTQGKFLDPDTGVWDRETAALFMFYPLVLWIALFAVCLGFRALLSALLRQISAAETGGIRIAALIL